MSSSRRSTTERLSARPCRAAAAVRRFACFLLCWLTLPGAALAAYGAEADDGVVLEYQLKAAFLYNIAKFVQWPAEASGPFTLCVSGELPLRVVRQTLAGKQVRGQPVVVRAADGAAGCQLLFLSAEAPPVLPKRDGDVLTVGESGDFLRRGSMIRLLRVDNRLRFEIARSVGERAGFKFSSQLLKLATPVADNDEGS